MPIEMSYSPAEIFMKHNDVTVYHVYKDNDPNEGMREYWFDTSEDSQDEGGFDVREFALQLGLEEKNESLESSDSDEWKRMVIRTAIDKGLVASKLK